METLKDNPTMQATKLFWMVFLPFTLGYFLTAFFNQINALLMHFIHKDIALSASAMGLITSVYLLAFSLFQLPLGALLDFFGARRVQAYLFCFAAIGIIIFGSAHGPTGLLIGRAIIGVGMSAGLMAGFKSLRAWIPANKIALANGCFMASGTLGALCSTAPAEFVLHYLSWRELLFVMAALTIVIAAIIFIFVPDEKNHSAEIKFFDQLKGVKLIYRSPYFWRIAPIAAAAFACNMAVVGLWAGPWFTEVAHLSISQSANHLFVLSLSLIAGILLNGMIADWLMHRFNLSITTMVGIGLGFFLIAQLLLLCQFAPGSYFLWVLFGFFGRTATLSYAAVSAHFPPSHAGRSTTALNLLFFLLAFFMQSGMGLIVNLWPRLSTGKYPVVAYETAFGIILGVQVLAYIWFFIKKVD
ncbi:MAG: sugar phosphate permease [Gammaproteobacteria bacterium]|jgi:MFS family permease|nr:sugar phosphate permease [Gammaproteobacteria bacterium]